MVKERIFKVRCFDTCVYTLIWPAFFVKWRHKATLKKILGWMFMFDYKNEETIRFLEEEMPGLQELVFEQTAEGVLRLEKEWRFQEACFEKERQDPDAPFPAGMTKSQIREERRKRKEFNSECKKGIAQAKKAFESAQKQARKDRDHAREAYDMYLEARGNYRVGV